MSRTQGVKTNPANVRMRVMLRDKPTWTFEEVAKVLIDNGLLPDTPDELKKARESFKRILARVKRDGKPPARGRPRKTPSAFAGMPTPSQPTQSQRTQSVPTFSPKPHAPGGAFGRTLATVVKEAAAGGDADAEVSSDFDRILLFKKFMDDAASSPAYDIAQHFADLTDRVGGTDKVRRCAEVMKALSPTPRGGPAPQPQDHPTPAPAARKPTPEKAVVTEKAVVAKAAGPATVAAPPAPVFPPQQPPAPVAAPSPATAPTPSGEEVYRLPVGAEAESLPTVTP